MVGTRRVRRAATRTRACRAPTTRSATAKAKKSSEPFPLMDLPDDVLYEIIAVCARRATPSCRKAFKHLASLNRRLRHLAIPTLFRSITMTDPDPEGADGSATLLGKLRHLASKPDILGAARYFVLVTCGAANRPYHYDTPSALWTALQAMPKLREISLRLPAGGSTSLVPLLESHLAHNPDLPVLGTVVSLSVHTRRPDELTDFIKLCPNLTNSYVDIQCCVSHCFGLRAVSNLPTLQYLMLSRIAPRPRDGDIPFGWTTDDIQAIANIVPNIKHLALIGQLEETKVSEFVDAFALFKKLERLDMTDEQIISQDFVDQALAAIMEDSDDDVGEEDITAMELDEHVLNECREDVAVKFFEKCPQLRKLFLSRCGEGELFEPEYAEDTGNGAGRIVTGAKNMTPSSWRRSLDLQSSFDDGFPKVLKVNDVMALTSQ